MSKKTYTRAKGKRDIDRLKKNLDKVYNLAGSIRDQATYCEDDDAQNIVKTACNQLRDAISKLKFFRFDNLINGYGEFD